jgi:hypothetical protein
MLLVVVIVGRWWRWWRLWRWWRQVGRREEDHRRELRRERDECRLVLDAVCPPPPHRDHFKLFDHHQIAFFPGFQIRTFPLSLSPQALL